MISETLTSCLTSDKDKKLLSDFEREKFPILHDIILNDDGFPDLYQKIKDIHISIPNFNVFRYQKLYMSHQNIKKSETLKSLKKDESLLP